MKKISSLLQFKHAICHASKKSKLLTVLFVLAVITSGLIAFSKDWTEQVFTNFFDAFAGIVTLLVAMGLALNNYNKTWKDNLPKTLTIHYTFNKKCYLSCFYADLTSEGDIRMWAQQIGSQMTGNSHLSFNPFFDLKTPEVIKLEPNGILSLHYELTILLNNLDFKQGPKIVGKLTDYKRWYVVHGKDHIEDRKIILKPIKPTSNFKQLNFEQAIKETNNESSI